jgi:hypothetical protein
MQSIDEDNEVSGSNSLSNYSNDQPSVESKPKDLFDKIKIIKS